MSYGKVVRDELRVPTRELRHAIPQVYDGYRELHDSALAPGALDAGPRSSSPWPSRSARNATAA